MGKRLARRMLVMVRRAGGERATGPSGEADQSLARMSAPISPPPRKHAHSAPEAVGRISAGTSSIEVKLRRWNATQQDAAASNRARPTERDGCQACNSPR